MPTRGSFNSRAISSVRSRWIWSATLKARLGAEDFFAAMLSLYPRSPYSVRAISLISKNSSWSPSLMSL